MRCKLACISKKRQLSPYGERHTAKWSVSGIELWHKEQKCAIQRNERKGIKMDTRVAVISIIVENPEVISTLNELLHEAGSYIIGRMGIPYREKGINIISIAIDAPQDMISSLSGKIGRLKGVSAKTAYSNIITKAEAQND